MDDTPQFIKKGTHMHKGSLLSFRNLLGILVDDINHSGTFLSIIF